MASEVPPANCPDCGASMMVAEDGSDGYCGDQCGFTWKRSVDTDGDTVPIPKPQHWTPDITHHHRRTLEYPDNGRVVLKVTDGEGVEVEGSPMLGIVLESDKATVKVMAENRAVLIFKRRSGLPEEQPNGLIVHLLGRADKAAVPKTPDEFLQVQHVLLSMAATAADLPLDEMATWIDVSTASRKADDPDYEPRDTVVAVRDLIRALKPFQLEARRLAETEPEDRELERLIDEA